MQMINDTFTIGFNHHFSNAVKRGIYSLNTEKQEAFYAQAFSAGLKSVCILNTCNRIEIYGFGDVDVALKIYLELIEVSDVDAEGMFKFTGVDAIKHIFQVASGLDSQVVGDLEILGQFKQAFHNAKKHNALNGYLERLANTATQTAKEIRSSTKISSGTISLSYAATKFIKKHFQQKPFKVLIIGTGEFGKKIALNVNDYLPKANIILCNRTRSKAEVIANKLGCEVYDFENITKAVEDADVIISSVNDTGKHLLNSKNVIQDSSFKLFVDMSIPLSIDPELAKNKTFDIVSLDEVSKEVNNTIESRKEDLPLAHKILDKHMNEFCTWAEMFEKSESIHQWKKIMQSLSKTCNSLSQLTEDKKNHIIGKNMANFANYIRNTENLPQDSQQIINHFLTKSDKAIACQKVAVGPQSFNINSCSACHAC